MSLIAAKDLMKSWGSSLIFEDVSFDIQDGERVGIVGPNGTGKSTLCALLLGQEAPDSGDVMIRRGATLGYLSQSNRFTAEHGALAETLTAFADLFAIESEQRELEQKMAEVEGAELEKLLARHAALQEKFEQAEGWGIHARVESVLLGLGLERHHFDQPVNQLSGGESSRVALAKLLLREPDLLILDEPTNHLDIAGCEWLEDYLSRHRGACILVSHDRLFLDRVTTRTLELAAGSITDYPCAYSVYEERKAEEFRRAREEYGAQQDFLRRERDFIRKNMGSQRTKEAKGRLKRLERMERLEPPRQENLEMRVSIASGRRLGVEIVEARDLSLGYGERLLLDGLNLRLEPGENLGIVGPNGAGKSTFLKALIGQLEPLAGSLALGKTVEVGYFDQLQARIDPKVSPYDLIASDSVQLTDLEIRSYLARFLFREEDVMRPSETFSGGERSKLALARVLLARPNLLVLDEPTNHLDIPSRKAVETILDEFDGAIVTVSHDRFFLDRICNRILWIEDGRFREAQGKFSDFRKRQLREAEDARRLREEEAQQRKSDEKEKKRREQAARPREKKRRSLEAVESDIMAAESRREAIHVEMANPETFRDAEAMGRLQQELKDLERTLATLEEEWSEFA